MSSLSRLSLPRASLSWKLGAIGAALLVLALASIGLTVWITWQLEGGAGAVNEAGRLRMETWRLAQSVQRSDAAALAGEARRFDATVALLKSGDPSRPLAVPSGPATTEAFAAVVAGWAELRARWIVADPPAPAVVAADAQAQVARIDRFVDAIEGQLARWTAVLTVFQLGLMGLAIAGGMALLVAAYLFVFNPLARLKAGLARVEQGDLSVRVDAASQDEFGQLAAGFNRMAATLQALYRDLEARVAQKTDSLRAERERLAVLYEASAFVGRATSAEDLAAGFARQVRRAARADASIVRMANVGQSQHALLASDCLPADMLEGERCIATGDCHCGQTQRDDGPRIVPIRPVEGHATSACERHGFAEIVTVPVRLHEQGIGEIDLLYRGPAVLDATDRALLDTLAAHLASGLESLRAAGLEREAAVAEERGLIARELHDSIAQGLAFLKIQVRLLRNAMTRGDAEATQHALAEVDTGIRESSADVRELLLHFRTRTNAEDIVPALKTTLQKFQHQTGLATHLDVHDHGLPLAADQQVQLLHVVQEALSNVRKHAQARAVWVDVRQQPEWSIEVRDDGRGFAADAPRDETHVGLRIMRERAAAIGAQVEVQSAEGGGTRVRVSLPGRQPLAA
jgi:two-component system nitrate/nitrite sensor histidine kinase NarX